MKIQQGTGNLYVNIPQTIERFMRWKKGEQVIISCNKSEDEITVKRISKNA